MQIRANCFYEKETEGALVNLAVDVGVADKPDFANIDEAA